MPGEVWEATRGPVMQCPLHGSFFPWAGDRQDPVRKGGFSRSWRMCTGWDNDRALCSPRSGVSCHGQQQFRPESVNQKEAICREVLANIPSDIDTDPLDIIKRVGDPMIPVAAGIAHTYTGTAGACRGDPDACGMRCDQGDEAAPAYGCNDRICPRRPLRKRGGSCGDDRCPCLLC